MVYDPSPHLRTGQRAAREGPTWAWPGEDISSSATSKERLRFPSLEACRVLQHLGSTVGPPPTNTATMAEKIGKSEDYTSHHEKNASPPEYNDLSEQAGRRGSVALNIVENPLKVSSKT